MKPEDQKRVDDAVAHAKKERKFGVSWTCPQCEGNPEFDHPQMMKHLAEVHQIDPKTTKGTKRMMMHVDGSDFYASQYEWTIGEKIFVQNACHKRTGLNKQMWMED